MSGISGKYLAAETVEWLTAARHGRRRGRRRWAAGLAVAMCAPTAAVAIAVLRR